MYSACGSAASARLLISLRRASAAGARGAAAAAAASRGPAAQVTTVVTLPWNASVLRWEAQEGQAIKAGQTLCEVETDTACVDFTSADDGILARILVPAPPAAPRMSAGAPVAVLAETADEAEAARAQPLSTWLPGLGSGSSVPGGSRAFSSCSGSMTARDAPLASHQVFPSARILMAEAGVSPAVVAGLGSGKAGRLTKGDILAFLGRVPASALAPPPSAAPSRPAVVAVGSSAAAAGATTAGSAAAASSAAAPAPASGLAASAGGWAAGRPPAFVAPSAAALAGAYPRLNDVRRGATDAKPSQVRRVISARLTESKATVPHSYAAMDCVLDALVALRASLKTAGTAVSVNDLVIKAAARALRDVPEANASYDARSDSVRAGAAIDISVAVATDGGLITPIVRAADALPLPAIGAKVRELAGRARAGKLKPDEFQGGSFTISNLGMFGSVNEFSAVINMPQACILAVGKGERKVVASPLTPGELARVYGGGKAAAAAAARAALPPPTVKEVMTVTLSADARVVDARVAGQFLQAFRHYVENPALLL